MVNSRYPSKNGKTGFLLLFDEFPGFNSPGLNVEFFCLFKFFKISFSGVLGGFIMIFSLNDFNYLLNEIFPFLTSEVKS